MKLNTEYDADFEETEPEDKDVKPMTKALVFLGLTAAAAIICAVLWNVTHGDRKDGGRDNSLARGNVEESAPEGDAGGRKSDSETVPEGNGGTAPEEDGKSGSGTTPEGNVRTAPGEDGKSDPGATAEGNVGTAPEEDGKSDLGTTAEGNGGTAPEEDGKSDPGASAEGNVGMASGEGTESAAGNNSPESGEAGSGGSGQKADVNAMVFAECADTVTPKEVINLRAAPSTAADNIVSQAVNGELLQRSGINNDTGWSRVEYNGQILYAVSRYLTTDLTAQPPASTADANSVSTKDGRTIVFADCDDNISPKMYVNLRLEPSTSEGNDTVHCRLEYGEIVHRTGISEDSGWSRVEYDGIVLYVVTSYMYVVEEEGQ